MLVTYSACVPLFRIQCQHRKLVTANARHPTVVCTFGQQPPGAFRGPWREEANFPCRANSEIMDPVSPLELYLLFLYMMNS